MDRYLSLSDIEGLFVGQLSASELEFFDAAVKRGWAYRGYEGVAGFMGLAKVRKATQPNTPEK